MDAKFITDKACALIKAIHGTVMEARELHGNSSERVDAILFNALGSFLIETKITRSDFLADRKKPFRNDPALGIGMYRWYACPEGLIKPEELPLRWGLIYVSDKKNRRAEMPVGYGGSLRIGTVQSTQGWDKAVYKHFGSPRPKDWQSPEAPRHKFAFNDRDMEKEWSFMFCLARRFKEEVGLKNLK